MWPLSCLEVFWLPFFNPNTPSQFVFRFSVVFRSSPELLLVFDLLLPLLLTFFAVPNFNAVREAVISWTSLFEKSIMLKTILSNSSFYFSVTGVFFRNWMRVPLMCAIVVLSSLFSSWWCSYSLNCSNSKVISVTFCSRWILALRLSLRTMISLKLSWSEINSVCSLNSFSSISDRFRAVSIAAWTLLPSSLICTSDSLYSYILS